MSISAVMSDLEAVGGEGSGQGASSKATEEVTLTAADIPGAGTASQGLPELLQKVKGEQLCVSLLFDPQFQAEEVSSPSSHNIPDVSNLKDTILNFKEALSITPERSREIERSTREQRNSDLWFS